MAKPQLQIEVRAKKDNIELLCAELGALRGQITQQLRPYVSLKLRAAVESCIEQNPAHTKKLGKDKLGQMKKKLLKLLEGSDKRLEKAFSDDRLWVHVGYELAEKDYFSQCEAAKRSFSDGVNRTLDGLLLEAQKLLAEYGYIAQPAALDRQFPGWKTDSALNLVYNARPGLPKHIEELMGQYKRGFEQLHLNKQRLRELGQKSERLEAVEMWKKA